MTKPTVMYLGRPVDKDSFRTYVFDLESNPKLVNSWKEYQEHMELGVWFSTKQDAMIAFDAISKKPKSVKKSNKGAVLVKDDHLNVED